MATDWIGTGFLNASATVTQSEGDRTADGFVETGTTTVLDSRGDFQQGGRAFEERAAFYETGDAIFFADASVVGVEVGDAVVVEHDDGRTLEMTVAEVIYDDDSLLLSFDG